jgi:hypothetical protein
MPFTEEEMRALQLLLQKELQAEIRPFRNEMNQRFDEVATQLDGLYDLWNSLGPIQSHSHLALAR